MAAAAGTLTFAAVVKAARIERLFSGQSAVLAMEDVAAILGKFLGM